MKRHLSVVALSALLLNACAKKEEKVEAKPVEPLSVKTVAAQTRVVDKAISVTGSLIADETVGISSEVPGRVAAINADFGQSVRKGQVLVELDKRELQLAVDRARAALSQSLARLGLDPNQESAKVETTPGIRQAQAQMEDAKSKFDNASRLVKTGDISQERFTEIQKQYQSRLASYEAAKDDSRTLVAGVQGIRSELQLAQKRLGDATIRAPFDGAVTEKMASVGQYVKENTPMLTIVKTNPIRLRVALPETAAGNVRVGTTLSFTTDAAPGAKFNAVVRELNPSLDAKSRTLTAEARLNVSDTRLRPGMFVQVELVTAKSTEIVTVPKQAVYNVAGLTKLFLIRNGIAQEKRITPGQDLNNDLEVSRDVLSPGDQVAVSGLTQLTNGMPVKAVPQASAPRT